jgi:hypothetical protein
MLSSNIFSRAFRESFQKREKYFSIENISDLGYILYQTEMKNLHPYWFLQSPVDMEHKYYVLMDFLQSVEVDLVQKKYSDQIQKVNRIYNDLKSFQKFKKLSDRTVKGMTQEEIEKTKELTVSLTENDEVDYILDNSLELLEKFISKINPYIEEIEKSLEFKIHNDKQLSSDRGYVVIRNNKNKKIKIYSWLFSIISVDDTDQVGLLLSELLDPIPVYTKSDKKILDFIRKEVKNFTRYNDCFIIVDLEKSKGEDEISFELMKERSIEFIVANYKSYLSSF